MTDINTSHLCPECRDVIMYCKCWMGREHVVSRSDSFQITHGDLTAQWDSRTLRLEGSEAIKASVRQLLTGEERSFQDGATVWMDEREPIAIAIIAKHLGYKLGPESPELPRG